MRPSQSLPVGVGDSPRAQPLKVHDGSHTSDTEGLESLGESLVPFQEPLGSTHAVGPGDTRPAIRS